MNHVHLGNLTTSLPADQPRTPSHPAVISTHLVLIPSYNTGARLFPTVATICRKEWPVWVVIDGSTDGTGQELARTAVRDPDLRVLVLPRNQGKGAAILHGLREAHARGFTHVVTVDADGQHSADHIETLVELSHAHPEAMVLGVPVFDASAPTERILGHRIAKFWSDLVTLWSGVGNSLFGFRVYPIAPLLRTFAETRFMRGFDFEFGSRHPAVVAGRSGGQRPHAGALFPARGRRGVPFQLSPRQYSVGVHVRTTVGRAAAPFARHIGAAARQYIAPLIDMIWAEI